MIVDHLDRFFMNNLYHPYQETKAAWCLWRRWRKLSRQLRFDMVQVANVCAVGQFFRLERRVPVVMRMSNYPPLWHKLAGSPQHYGQRLRLRLEEWATRGTRWVYAPTRFVAEQVRLNYRLPKVDVIETPFFAEQPSEDKSRLRTFGLSEIPYFLFFGNMTQMKGVHVLAHALPRVLARFPDACAVLIGPCGPPAPDGRQMREYIADRTRSVADRVHLLDSMPHDQLYPFVRRARFVVLPSLVDNMPNTCLEAMGLGRVVIATTGSCFEELIVNGKSGWLVPPGDHQALAAAIEDAWSAPDERLETMGLCAETRIAELHPNRILPKLIAYYESIIADFHARAQSVSG